MPYIEIKTREVLGLVRAKKIVAKGSVSAVLTTGKITKEARKLFNEHDIAYAENVPESEFTQLIVQEDS
ncbi:hypothetical protein RIVM261_014240 [Rivularia sp. IAM M-261]|nr:hypothetical protein RIVM261_014240 [Rivularia sp. IAM M-261]